MARERDTSGRFVKGGNGITWDDPITPRLNAMPTKLRAALYGVMLFHEPQVESHMKSTAPWNDQTSNARNGLGAKAFANANNVGIVCFHSVPYGIWLEVKHSGRYKVIIPTIISQGREVMQTVNGLLGRMK